MWRIVFPTALALGLLGSGAVLAQEKSSPAPKSSAAKTAAPKVQIAVLLDTSNSMDGLINQARAQIWEIVNQMAQARLEGREVHLEVALFQYGNNSLPAKEGFIQLVAPFTDDLDLISDKLFALKTNGGSEYCGMVIQKALQRLRWSDNPQDLKMIVIAGNEPFTQGPVDPFQVCSEAIKRDITVTTIHCGPRAEGVRTGWEKGARLADGSYMNIDQKAEVAIATPFDKKLAQLGVELNKTYVFYGSREQQQARAKLQFAQDLNARKLGAPVAANRAAAKASGLYRNAQYDLVDAVQQGKADLKKLNEEELPPELKKLSPEQRKAYIEKMAKRRKELQEQIRQLDRKRRQWIAQRRKELAQKGKNTFQDAVLQALRQQAARKRLVLPAE